MPGWPWRHCSRAWKQRARRNAVLLVTSALHMARACAEFEAVGPEALPAATDHEGRITAHWPWWQRWLPSTDALDGSARGVEGT
jgi:uncharacterized SAM-binding protein YcdF (DUF218 family)